MKQRNAIWISSFLAALVLVGCSSATERVVQKGKVEGMVWFNPAEREVLQFRRDFVIQTKWDSTEQGLKKTERFFTYSIDTVKKELHFNNTSFNFRHGDSLGFELKKKPAHNESAVVYNSAHNFLQAEKALAGLSKQVHITGNVEVLGTGLPVRAKVVYERIVGKEEDAFRYETKNDSLNGSYSLLVPMGYKYRASAENPSYLGESRIVSLYKEQFKDSGRVTSWHENPLHVVAFKKGATIRLHSVFFDFDKSVLLKESYSELESLANLLKANQKVIIEIAGHTDNIGTKAYNQWLSEKRAFSVKNFLVANGMDATRIQTIGYGETRPLTSNDDEEAGRALNRRIELRIVEY